MPARTTSVVTNDFDWHERHVLLKAAFPLAASGRSQRMKFLTAPFSGRRRGITAGRRPSSRSLRCAGPTWAMASTAFSLINESKYGYDAEGNVLRLSLLRAPTEPDPEADQGHHHFSYALYPHAGDWKQALSVRHGYDFDYKLKGMQVEAHAGECRSGTPLPASRRPTWF